MVCCSAPNCTNSSRKGFRLFRFPVDPTRRKQWMMNCRRDKWEPKDTSRLCEVHFERSQWELKRKDGWIRLKPNAIPTLFHVKNPTPKFLQSPRKSKYKRAPYNETSVALNTNNGQLALVDVVLNNGSELEMNNVLNEHDHAVSNDSSNNLLPEDEIKCLKEQNKKLKIELSTLTSRCQAIQQQFQISNDKFEEEIQKLKTMLQHKMNFLQSFLNND